MFVSHLRELDFIDIHKIIYLYDDMIYDGVKVRLTRRLIGGNSRGGGGWVR